MQATASEKLKVKVPWEVCSRAETTVHVFWLPLQYHLHYSMLLLQLSHSASRYARFIHGASPNIHNDYMSYILMLIEMILLFKKSTIKGTSILLLIRYSLQNTPNSRYYKACYFPQRGGLWSMRSGVKETALLRHHFWYRPEPGPFKTSCSKRNNALFLAWSHQRGVGTWFLQDQMHQEANCRYFDWILL